MKVLKNYKVRLNIILCRLGIRDVLPREAIRKMKGQENNAPLVDISKDKSFFFSDELKPPILLRNEAYKKLKEASTYLPKDLRFKIYYRSISEQRSSWKTRIDETKKENPNLPDTEIERLTRLKIANPFAGYGGHQTGGALDITLCNAEGQELNLGTKIPEHNNKTKTKSPTKMG